MNTVERLRAAYTGQPVDRVPICAWIGLPLLKRLLGKGARAILEETVRNPFEIIKIQEDLGLDPIMVTLDDRWFSSHRHWRLLYSFPEEALESWQVSQEMEDQGYGFFTYRFTATTPEGPVTWSYQLGDCQVGEVEPAIKDEKDLDLLIKYMPEPENLNQDNLTAMVKTVGDRAFFTHNFIGVWGEAANMRGLVNLTCDLIEQPHLVKKLSEFLMERAIRRVRHQAKSGIHSIIYDQTWVGMGFSPAQYMEYMLPYDQPVVEAARDAGLLVSYHNCGQGMTFIEEMASTGADALETLTPKQSSGDFDLTEAKRRVGDQITLNGGFNERILGEATPEQVRDEVKRCIDSAASGGRYILRSTGQIFDTAAGNIEVFTETGREYGSY